MKGSETRFSLHDIRDKRRRWAAQQSALEVWGECSGAERYRNEKPVVLRVNEEMCASVQARNPHMLLRVNAYTNFLLIKSSKCPLPFLSPVSHPLSSPCDLRKHSTESLCGLGDCLSLKSRGTVFTQVLVLGREFCTIHPYVWSLARQEKHTGSHSSLGLHL